MVELRGQRAARAELPLFFEVGPGQAVAQRPILVRAPAAYGGPAAPTVFVPGVEFVRRDHGGMKAQLWKCLQQSPDGDDYV